MPGILSFLSVSLRKYKNFPEQTVLVCYGINANVMTSNVMWKLHEVSDKRRVFFKLKIAMFVKSYF